MKHDISCCYSLIHCTYVHIQSLVDRKEKTTPFGVNVLRSQAVPCSFGKAHTFVFAQRRLFAAQHPVINCLQQFDWGPVTLSVNIQVWDNTHATVIFNRKLQHLCLSSECQSCPLQTHLQNDLDLAQQLLTTVGARFIRYCTSVQCLGPSDVLLYS